jgi:hypothetical protein
MANQPYGQLDESPRLGPSEYDDDDLGWAGRDDLGESIGRALTGGERAAKFRRDMNADLNRPDDAV